MRLRFERRVSELPGAEGPRETGCMADLGIEAPPARRRANGAERGSTMATSIMDSGAGESAKGGGIRSSALCMFCARTPAYRNPNQPKAEPQKAASLLGFVGWCGFLWLFPLPS